MTLIKLITKAEQIKVYSEDVVHMAPENDLVREKNNLLAYLKEQAAYGYSEMKHNVIEFSEHVDVIIIRGELKGVFYPEDGDKCINLQAKNLLVFDRIAKELKIKKVMYNRSPIDK